MSVSEKYFNFNKKSRGGLKGAISGPSEVYEWNGFLSCTYSTLVVVYTTSPNIDVGVTLYTDEALTTTYDEVYGLNSSFSFEGNVFFVGENGVVSSVFACAAPLTVYSGCGDTVPAGTVYLGGPFELGTVVYSSPYTDPVNVFPNALFGVDIGSTGISNFTFATSDFGVILTIDACGS